MEQYIITLDGKDNVGVAVRPLSAGRCYAVSGRAGQVTAQEDIAFGHKIALCDLADCEPILKYGEIIGLARGVISAGRHVHMHNMRNSVDQDMLPL